LCMSQQNLMLIWRGPDVSVWHIAWNPSGQLLAVATSKGIMLFDFYGYEPSGRIETVSPLCYHREILDCRTWHIAWHPSEDYVAFTITNCKTCRLCNPRLVLARVYYHGCYKIHPMYSDPTGIAIGARRCFESVSWSRDGMYVVAAGTRIALYKIDQLSIGDVLEVEKLWGVDSRQVAKAAFKGQEGVTLNFSPKPVILTNNRIYLAASRGGTTGLLLELDMKGCPSNVYTLEDIGLPSRTVPLRIVEDPLSRYLAVLVMSDRRESRLVIVRPKRGRLVKVAETTTSGADTIEWLNTSSIAVGKSSEKAAYLEVYEFNEYDETLVKVKEYKLLDKPAKTLCHVEHITYNAKLGLMATIVGGKLYVYALQDSSNHL